jgi:hypothetical protein
MSKFKDKIADEIAEGWQCKALRASKGKLRQVVIVALAKEYPEALITLLKVAFPGFVDISRPMFIGYAHIDLGGNIVCDMVESDDSVVAAQIGTEQSFIYAIRKLADELKLDDKDRSEMFVVLQKWVASDKRKAVKLAS